MPINGPIQTTGLAYSLFSRTYERYGLPGVWPNNDLVNVYKSVDLPSTHADYLNTINLNTVYNAVQNNFFGDEQSARKVTYIRDHLITAHFSNVPLKTQAEFVLLFTRYISRKSSLAEAQRELTTIFNEIDQEKALLLSTGNQQHFDNIKNKFKQIFRTSGLSDTKIEAFAKNATNVVVAEVICTKLNTLLPLPGDTVVPSISAGGFVSKLVTLLAADDTVIGASLPLSSKNIAELKTILIAVLAGGNELATFPSGLENTVIRIRTNVIAEGFISLGLTDAIKGEIRLLLNTDITNANHVNDDALILLTTNIRAALASPTGFTIDAIRTQLATVFITVDQTANAEAIVFAACVPNLVTQFQTKLHLTVVPNDIKDALRRNGGTINNKDIETAIDNIVAGLKHPGMTLAQVNAQLENVFGVSDATKSKAQAVIVNHYANKIAELTNKGIEDVTMHLDETLLAQRIQIYIEGPIGELNKAVEKEKRVKEMQLIFLSDSSEKTAELLAKLKSADPDPLFANVTFDQMVKAVHDDVPYQKLLKTLQERDLINANDPNDTLFKQVESCRDQINKKYSDLKSNEEGKRYKSKGDWVPVIGPMSLKAQFDSMNSAYGELRDQMNEAYASVLATHGELRVEDAFNHQLAVLKTSTDKNEVRKSLESIGVTLDTTQQIKSVFVKESDWVGQLSDKIVDKNIDETDAGFTAPTDRDYIESHNLLTSPHFLGKSPAHDTAFNTVNDYLKKLKSENSVEFPQDARHSLKKLKNETAALDRLNDVARLFHSAETVKSEAIVTQELVELKNYLPNVLSTIKQKQAIVTEFMSVLPDADAIKAAKNAGTITSTRAAEIETYRQDLQKFFNELNTQRLLLESIQRKLLESEIHERKSLLQNMEDNQEKGGEFDYVLGALKTESYSFTPDEYQEMLTTPVPDHIPPEQHEAYKHWKKNQNIGEEFTNKQDLGDNRSSSGDIRIHRVENPSVPNSTHFFSVNQAKKSSTVESLPQDAVGKFNLLTTQIGHYLTERGKSSRPICVSGINIQAVELSYLIYRCVYNVPKNALVLNCGTIAEDEARQKQFEDMIKEKKLDTKEGLENFFKEGGLVTYGRPVDATNRNAETSYFNERLSPHLNFYQKLGDQVAAKNGNTLKQEYKKLASELHQINESLAPTPRR